MKIVQIIGLAVSLLGVAGCAAPEVAEFSPAANQQSIVRDGLPALVSRQKSSIVMVSPAARQMQAGARPVFIIAATNLSAAPINLAISNISVSQTTDTGAILPLRVIPYEQLVSEERTREVVGAILVGAAAAGNAYSASRAGYGTATGTVYTPYGTSVVTANYYSPTAAAIAQGNASAENEAMIASTIEIGQRNLSQLENTVLKDNTIMPGEWIGGQVHFEPPQGDTGHPKAYQITVSLGADTHVIQVTQVPSK